jgi:chemotaxis protein methyltransferase CheR
VDGGYLLVNPAEASTSLFPMFATENIGGVTLYRKTSQPTRVESWPRLVSPAPAVPVPEPAFIVAPAPPVPVAPEPPVAPTPAPPREDLLARARACANQGRLEEALASCQDAIAAERTNPAAHFLHAAICQELGRPEDAVAALGRVLYLDQDFILAHHALGGLHKRLGRQKESRRHLAVALELLSSRRRDEIVPESDGMTCGRLVESVRAMTEG